MSTTEDDLLDVADTHMASIIRRDALQDEDHEECNRYGVGGESFSVSSFATSDHLEDDKKTSSAGVSTLNSLRSSLGADLEDTRNTHDGEDNLVYDDSDVTFKKKSLYPSLKKGFQKRLGLGKYATTPNPKSRKDSTDLDPRNSAPAPLQNIRCVFFRVPLSLQPTVDDVPMLLVAILEYCYKFECYKEEGFFRIAGSNTRVLELQKICDEVGHELIEKDVFKDERDPHVISSFLKSWLQSLPEPIIPLENYEQLLLANKTENLAVKTSQFATHVATMPLRNRLSLKHILYFSNLVIANSDITKMKLSNVASVLVPTIMRTSDSRDFMMSFGPASGCLVFMLSHFDDVFGHYSPLIYFEKFPAFNPDFATLDLSTPLDFQE